jgi:hypothetical protein
VSSELCDEGGVSRGSCSYLRFFKIASIWLLILTLLDELKEVSSYMLLKSLVNLVFGTKSFG